MELSKPTLDPPKTLNGAANGGATLPGPRPAFPAPPSAKPHPYRPCLPPPRRRSRRICCCIIFLWLILFLIAVVFLLAVAAGVFYVMYNPQRPSFTISSLRLSALNVTASDLITERLSVAITVRNPNENIEFNYGDTAVSATVRGVAIGVGTIPGFTQSAENTKSFKVMVASLGETMDPTEAEGLKRQLKTMRKVPLEMEIDTKLGVRIRGIKTKGIGIRAVCDRIDVAVAKRNATAAAGESTAVKCKVKLRVQVWNWTF